MPTYRHTVVQALIATMERIGGEMLARKYSDDQPRDEQGQWTSGGGGAGGGGEGYIPDIETEYYNGTQGERAITSDELKIMQNRISNLPSEIKALEPDKTYTIEGLHGPRTMKDYVEVSVIEDIGRSEMGSAWAKNNELHISGEFIDTPIFDHEYLHTITFRNKTILNGIQEEYHPPKLYFHAEHAQNSQGEQFVMTMTAYHKDRNNWVSNVMKIEPRITNEDARGQVEEIERFLKAKKIW